MPYQIGYVDNTGSEGYAHWQMLLTIHHFAGGYGTLGTPALTGTGNGTLTKLDTHPATVTETWTIKCTSVPSAGNEVWSVTGSVSGAKASATTGVAYDNGLLAFTIAAGSTAFAVNDAFTVAATQGALSASGQAWTVLQYTNSTDLTKDRELILQGKGLSGTDQIFIGFRTYQSVSADYYNISAAAFTGFIANTPWASQPGYYASAIPAHNQRIDYWLQANAQRINLAFKITGPIYTSGGAGLFFPLATPSQYPLPLYVGGMLAGEPATRYSDPSVTMAWKGSRTQLGIRWMDGSWKNLETYPWDNASLAGAYTLRDTNNVYPVIDVLITDTTLGNIGYFDGIGYVSNFNNTVESTVSANGVNWVCIQDGTRTSFSDYFCMSLN